MAAFDRRPSLFECESSWCAEQPVAHHIEARLRVALPFPFGHVRGKDCRSVIDWRVDSTVLAFRVAAEMGQEGVLAVIPWPTITLHKVHSTFQRRFGTDRHSEL